MKGNEAMKTTLLALCGLVAVLAVAALGSAARPAEAVTVRPAFAEVCDIAEDGELHDRQARAEARAQLARINREKAAETAAEQAETEAAAQYEGEGYWEPCYGETAPDTPSYAPTGGLTKEGGVNYHDGRIETYYSSNVLRHKDTAQWTVDEEGFYRDDQGRYVVAASDKTQGETFEGSKGECVVLDTGCAEGVTDYYVRW